MKAKIILLAAALLVLAACAGPGGGNFLGINPAGAEGPAPTQHRETVDKAIRASLKDPYSAIIEVGEPRLGSCAVGIYGQHHAWRVPVSYNAKNSYGGYVGVTHEDWWFVGERVTKRGSGGMCY